MKQLISLTLIVMLFLLSCSKESGNASDQQTKDQEAQATSIEQIKLKDFPQFAPENVGTEIKVTGIVDHICKLSGKKMHIQTEDQTVEVEVVSDDLLDSAIIGKKIEITGIIKEKIIDQEYLNKVEEKIKQLDDEQIKEKALNNIQKMRDSIANTPEGKIVKYVIKLKQYKVLDTLETKGSDSPSN